jgi:cellulose synthase/poly-beta-1,6-N-acetylglucosamine synthase-like glycosyltransferase
MAVAANRRPAHRSAEQGPRRGEAEPDLQLSVRLRRNIAIRKAYVECAETTGPPVAPDRPNQPVEFRSVLSFGARVVLTLFVLACAGSSLFFLGWLLLPEHVPGATLNGGGWQLSVARVSYVLMIIVELIRFFQSVTVCVFAYFAKNPMPMNPPIGLRVALLTTIVPSKEPLEVAERTLRKMKQVLYAGKVDVWILDEGDDPAVKAMAARIGVHHFSRKGRPEYNQPSGQFRARTKSGNHNAWRAEHEHEYDVVANVDPDHVPMPSFLERTLGYFGDPDVAFVVSPQVYGNMYQNWVAHGASVQQYLFNGIIARGGNGMDAPLLTGTGHLYRPSAWRQIGGYQDSIIEDHVTSIKIHATVNPKTGNYWKGVYTPDVVAIGEGPTSWADYFNQQKRWAYGVWEILLRPDLRQSERLPMKRRWQYRLLQFYYPSVAISLLLGNFATAVYLLTGVSSVKLDGGVWFSLWAATLVAWFGLLLWLRRYNVAPHEREEVGMPGMGLALFAGPIYVAAGAAAVLRRKLAFVVTAKGKLRTNESLGTFRLHFVWAALAAALLAVSFVGHHDFTLLRIWAGLTLATGLAPPVAAMISDIGSRRHPEPSPVDLIRYPQRDDPTSILPTVRERPLYQERELMPGRPPAAIPRQRQGHPDQYVPVRPTAPYPQPGAGRHTEPYVDHDDYPWTGDGETRGGRQW